MVYKTYVDVRGDNYNYHKKNLDFVCKMNQSLLSFPEATTSRTDLQNDKIEEQFNSREPYQTIHQQLDQEQLMQPRLDKHVGNGIEIKDKDITRRCDHNCDDNSDATLRHDDEKGNRGEYITELHMQDEHYQSNRDSNDRTVVLPQETTDKSSENSEQDNISSNLQSRLDICQITVHDTDTVLKPAVAANEASTLASDAIETDNRELPPTVDDQKTKEDLADKETHLLCRDNILRTGQVLKLSTKPTIDRQTRAKENQEHRLTLEPRYSIIEEGGLSPRVIQGDLNEDTPMEPVLEDQQQIQDSSTVKGPRRNSGVKRRKLVAIGNLNCGKTSLLVRMSGESSISQKMPTVLGTKIANLQITETGEDLELILWDTTAKSRYDTLRSLAYPGSDVIMLCYSIDDVTGMDDVTKRWIPELRHYCPEVSIVLVATKIDLREDRGAIEEMWTTYGRGPISTTEGAALATRIGAMDYAECSAKSGESMEDVVQAAGRIALLSRRRIQHEKKNKECVIL